MRLGNYHDVFQRRALLAKQRALPEVAEIAVEALFLSTDCTFYTKELHQLCAIRHIADNSARNPYATDRQTDDDIFSDEVLDRRRLVIEQANTWLNGSKTLFVCYETDLGNWLVLMFLPLRKAIVNSSC